MGPTSDLGPVDPQFQFPDGKLVSAKAIIAAVTAAEQAVQANPESFPIHASLLSGVDALMVQGARAAMARSGELLREALRSQPDRTETEVEELFTSVQQKLIETSTSHAAAFGSADAKAAGLPVTVLDPMGEQWQLLWRLWTKYFVTAQRWFEGVQASKCLCDRLGF